MGDIGRDREPHTIDIDRLVLALGLFQSQSQPGSASGVVVDQDASGPARGELAREDRAEVLSGGRGDEDQESTSLFSSA
jgi:hypothetical protein